MSSPLAAPALGRIRDARARIAGIAMRTPLVPLGADAPTPRILLKLENLQPIGSFKLRGAANAMMLAGKDRLAAGVYTASAGNMAQGVAWCARALGVPCQVIVPDSAPTNKLEAIARLGGVIRKVPFDEWWRTLVEHRHPGIPGVFIHPFADNAVMEGTATIGLEILEDAPDVDAILVPWGGGGLACGIAAAARAINPRVRTYAVEVDAAAPLHAAFERSEATLITPARSFVDGIGGKSVLPEMWTLARTLLSGVYLVSVAQVAAAVKLLAERNRVVAEGAGAAATAAALTGEPAAGTIACVVSGGNIDSIQLAAILRGETP